MKEDFEKKSNEAIDDIKYNSQIAKKSRFEIINLARIPQKDFGSFPYLKIWIRRIGVIFFSLLFLGIAFGISTFNETKHIGEETMRTIANNFSFSVAAIENFEVPEAMQYLSNNENEIKNLNNFFNEKQGRFFIPILKIFLPVFGNEINFFDSVSSFNKNFILFTQSLSEFETEGLRYIQEDGTSLVSLVDRFYDQIHVLRKEIQLARNSFSNAELSFLSPEYKKLLNEDYLRYSADLITIEQFINEFSLFLKSSTDKNFLIAFQNIDIARPGGGLAHIYANVKVRNGQIQSISFYDAHEIDKTLSVAVIPPNEMKTVVRRWGAENSNWFFDFPKSAEALLYFFENSSLFLEKNEKFDGVFAINTRAIENVLDITGSINIDDKTIPFLDSKNFHNDIEKNGGKGIENDKYYFSKFIPELLENIKKMDSEKRRLVSRAIISSIQKKDVMFYFRNPDIKNFLSENNIDGGIYSLPNNFFGNYLAVVNANISGRKSGTFIQQNIEAHIDLDSNAGVFTDLTINQKNLEKDAWWRIPNRNFISVYTNPKTALVSLKGNNNSSEISRFDYIGNGYKSFPDLKSIEETKVFLDTYNTWEMQTFGKTTFSTWFNVNPNEEKNLEIRYQLPNTKERAILSGDIFTFVFERQSGVNSSLKVSISAPLGFSFKESGGPLYIFEDNSGKGRIIIPLTLLKQYNN